MHACVRNQMSDTTPLLLWFLLTVNTRACTQLAGVRACGTSQPNSRGIDSEHGRGTAATHVSSSFFLCSLLAASSPQANRQDGTRAQSGHLGHRNPLVVLFSAADVRDKHLLQASAPFGWLHLQQPRARRRASERVPGGTCAASHVTRARPMPLDATRHHKQRNALCHATRRNSWHGTQLACRHEPCAL